MENMKVVGYGINISYGNDSFERVATFNDENVAKTFYNLLLQSEEIKFGAIIDLEKIYEVKGDYEYEVVLQNYKLEFNYAGTEQEKPIMVTTETFEKAKQCLIDNDIEEVNADSVLRTLCYILTDIVTQETFDKAKQCLIENGIETDEADIVLQALCYILTGEETEQFFSED